MYIGNLNINALEIMWMEYDKRALDILKQLRITNLYKGCDYIASSIEFIHENNTTYMPVTKILYVDIARQYNTSSKCVEKDIRKVIEAIWRHEKKKPIISSIFDTHFINKRPSNMEFLLSLYRHIEAAEYTEQVYNFHKDNIQYTCPLNNKQCGFCNDILYEIIHKIYT